MSPFFRGYGVLNFGRVTTTNKNKTPGKAGNHLWRNIILEKIERSQSHIKTCLIMTGSLFSHFNSCWTTNHFSKHHEMTKHVHQQFHGKSRSTGKKGKHINMLQTKRPHFCIMLCYARSEQHLHSTNPFLKFRSNWIPNQFLGKTHDKNTYHDMKPTKHKKITPTPVQASWQAVWNPFWKICSSNRSSYFFSSNRGWSKQK